MSYVICACLFVWILVIQSRLDKFEIVLKKMNNRFKTGVVLGNKSEEQNSEAQPVSQIITQTEQEPIVNPSATEQKEVFDKEPDSQKFEKIEKSHNFGITDTFLGNISNKIGAAAIIVALIIFIKLISSYFVFTPAIKLTLSYLFGFIIIGFGIKLHKSEKLKAYSEVLLGVGFADLFIATFCAYSLFHIFNGAAVLCAGATLLACTYVVSDKMKTMSMLIIGLIGGYLTPCFSGAEPSVIFTYLIFLNAVSLIYSYRNKKYNFINILNLIITMFTLIIFNISYKVSIVYPLVLWGEYIIYDLFRDKTGTADNILSGLNYSLLTCFSLILFKNAHHSLLYLFMATAGIYCLLDVISRKNGNILYKQYEHFVMLNVWLYGMFAYSYHYSSVIFWSVFALLFSGLISKFKLNHLKPMLGFYFFSTLVGALSVRDFDNNYCLMAEYNPVINYRTLLFGVPVISMFLTSLNFRQEDAKFSNWLNFGCITMLYLCIVGEIYSILAISNADSSYNLFMAYIILGFVYSLQMSRMYDLAKEEFFRALGYIVYGITLFVMIIGSYFAPSDYLAFVNLRFAAYLISVAACLKYLKRTNLELFKYIAVVLGFFAFHFEICCVANSLDLPYLISVFWALYSGGVTICGILQNKKYLQNSGIGILILTILRIFIFDLATVDAIYKVIAFLTLGMILMLVSYVYTKYKK